MGVLKITRIALILTSVIVVLMSCQKIRFKDDELQLGLRSYNGDELRIYGYYYRVKYFQGIPHGVPFFFFQNGILVNLGTFEINNQQSWEESINGVELNSAINHRQAWGIFNIDGNNIKFEKWYPSSSRHLPTYVREGEILNDTTFHISESYRLTKKGKKKECKELDETYFFKQFSPKPDSTNCFVP